MDMVMPLVLIKKGIKCNTDYTICKTLMTTIYPDEKDNIY